MTELIVGIIVVVVAVVGWVVAQHYAKRRTDRVVAEIADWDDWDAPARAGAARKMLLRLTDEVANLRKGFLLFSIAVIAAMTWAVLSIQDTADESQRVVAEVQESTCTFLRVQNTDLTDQIRQRQVRRDATAEEIIELQNEILEAPELEDLAGFNDLPTSVQVFIRGLAAGSEADKQTDIADAERRLAAHDEDLLRLRAQVDDIRKLSITAACP